MKQEAHPLQGIGRRSQKAGSKPVFFYAHTNL